MTNKLAFFRLAILKSPWFKLLLSLSVGLLFLSLAIKSANGIEIKQIIAHAHLEWCLLGLLFYSVAIVLRSLRWQWLLTPIRCLSYKQVLKSLIVGYSVNNILPARLGELFRADYVKRHYHLNRSAVLGSIALERLVDGIIVICALLVGIMSVRTKALNESIIIPLLITAAVLFGLLTLLFIMFSGRQQFNLLKKSPLIQNKIREFAKALRVIRSRSMISVILLSVIIWSMEAISIQCILHFAGITLTLGQLLVTIGVVSLATLLPSPPGYLGVLQYAYILVVGIFGFDSSAGFVAATASQLFLMGPLTLTGLSILAFDALLPVVNRFAEAKE